MRPCMKCLSLVILLSRLKSRSEEPLQGSLEGLAARLNLVLNGSTPQELPELANGVKGHRHVCPGIGFFFLLLTYFREFSKEKP